MAETAPRGQCPQCAAGGGDKTKDNLITFSDGQYCNACGYTKSNKKLTALIPGTVMPLVERKLLLSICEHYNVRTKFYTGRINQLELDENITIYPIYENGKVVKQKIKSQLDGKKITARGDTKCMRLFGQQAFNPTKRLPIVITEGEYDAMSIYQVTGLPSVSITRGSNGAQKELLENLEWLSQWREVLLCFDMDEPGREAATECIGIFEPGTCKNISLPLKDANEMLKEGREGEIKRCIQTAENIRPSTIVFPMDILDDILTPPVFGVPWPWKFMTKVTYGNRPGEVYMLAGDTSVGKELPISALISTPSGWKAMGDIKVGDIIHGYQGITKVVRVYPQGPKPIYRLTFSDGRTCEAGLEHLWEIKTHRQLQRSRERSENVTSVMTTLELMQYSGKKGLFLKVCKPVYGEHKNFIIPPYSLGVLIGDGCLTMPGICVSSNEPDIVEKVGKELKLEYVRNPHNYTYRFKTLSGDRRYRLYLLNAGLCVTAPCKHIPEEYLRASISQRRDLLKGLMDTDGHVSTTGSFSFSTTSYKLKDDVVELCRGLGYIVSITTDKRDKYRDGVCYKINIQTNEIIFNSEKHLRRYNKAKETIRNRLYYNDHLKLISIEYCREEEAQCITVDAPDALYLTNNYIVTHNTQLVYEIVSQHIASGSKVGLIDLERQNAQTMQRIIGNMLNMKLHLPTDTKSNSFPSTEVKHHVKQLQDSLALYRPESGKLSVDSVLINIRYLNKAYGITFFVLDNLTALSVNMPSGMKEYEFASIVTGQLVQIAKELNVTIFIINHLTKSPVQLNADITMGDDFVYSTNKEGLTWESGRCPEIGHIYGGGKVAKLPDFLIVCYRNRLSKDDKERRTLKLKFLKTRFDSEFEGEEFKLLYNPEIGRYEEIYSA